MTRKLIAILLVLGLAACQREASNEPESTTDVTPAEATPTDSTAATTPPAASTPTQTPAPATDTSMASEQPTTSPAPAATMGDDVVDPMATPPATAAGGSTLGGTQTDATLEADLRRCDTMTGTERTTCRSEAQTQYDQRSLESGASVEP